jgi:hypothetical protein
MLRRVILDGAIACVPFTIVAWTTFRLKPRWWLHSLPDDIQAAAGPKSAAERRATVWMGAIVLLCFFGVPIFLTWRLDAATPGGLSFGDAFLHLYGAWMIVNLWDLVGIDWPYAYLMDPDRPPIAGTAGLAGYKDYGFHARKFVKASMLSLLVIVPAAALIVFLPAWQSGTLITR